MTKKFGIRDLKTQEYVFLETPEEATAFIAKQAFEEYLHRHNHGTLYTVVDFQEDGGMLWYAPTGEPMLSPEEIEAQIAAMMAPAVTLDGNPSL